MTNWTYYFFRAIVRMAMSFSFRERRLVHKERIPKKDPIILLPNHQNALVDAIMIAPLIARPLHFITRADVFKNPIVGRFLRSINLIPIYRLRDGRDTLVKNEQIMKECATLLSNGGALQIFPEGNHHTDRRVRVFKNGFINIAFLALEQNPDLPLKLVPVGLNYDSRERFAARVHINLGTPIDVRDYYDPANPKEAMRKLNEAVVSQVKSLTTHIEPKEKYKELLAKLEDEGIDFLDPDAANALIKSQNFTGNKAIAKKKTFGGMVIYYLFLILNIIPLSLWWSRKKKIKDPAFIATMRFVFVMVVFPIYYLLVGWIIAHFWGTAYGLGYIAFSILLGYLRKRLPYWY